MERSTTIWLVLFVGSLSGAAYAGPSAECLSAQETAKRQIQQEQLRVASEEDGIYGSAVKMRRIYRITLDAITGVCPQGAVDYYQSQHDIAMRSACQSSSTDMICAEMAQQAQVDECNSRIDQGVAAVPNLEAPASYNNVQHKTGHLAMVAFVTDLIANGTCPETEENLDRIAAWTDQAAEYERRVAEQAARAAQQAEYERQVAQQRREQAYEDSYNDDDDDGSSGWSTFGSIMAPLVGTVLQQQLPQGSGGSSHTFCDVPGSERFVRCGGTLE